MLLTMKIFITDQQKAELERLSEFFNQTLPDIAGSLSSRINDHFQVLKSAS
ncbi:hypothetical protein LZ008_23915 (plasmid) [Salmonella enterica subsp. enterica serovar Infantis]|uniref:hypothetical protein n=1 Tax=Salmonella enterica TaxID=28901 RepID=UPI001F46DD67|nr:hypothetical protein [Salmonella enterica]MCE9720329.1 hypothetical protein [Salmonella enterica subsp. enterica serovar Infantis]